MYVLKIFNCKPMITLFKIIVTLKHKIIFKLIKTIIY